VDDQRNSQADHEQEPAETSETATARPTTMFDVDDERETSEEMTRLARKRAAIWGLAAGGVMSLIIVICAVLVYLLGAS
jgi:hypothetical protein